MINYDTEKDMNETNWTVCACQRYTMMERVHVKQYYIWPWYQFRTVFDVNSSCQQYIYEYQNTVYVW